ncbi:MAG: hypothetical protein HY721_06250 [Planctomycetes bacterium]|nr:hypothetical protein [Planctomycetota bacterium]
MGSDRRLFGEVAFEKGYITSEQLYEGLAVQAKAEVLHKPYKFLGQILMELGYLTEKQVLEILSELHAPEPTREPVKESVH